MLKFADLNQANPIITMQTPNHMPAKPLSRNACIISIGEELLIGQTVNTNASWMASRLNSVGIRVIRIYVITDDKEDIIETIRNASDLADLVLITGGLGPTRDDVTKHALCSCFNTSLKMDEGVLADIEVFFKNRGLQMIEMNRMQALVPEKATAIRNPYGTAPGLWFEEAGKITVSMPGVPFEMQHMFDNNVIPEISKRIPPFHIVHRTILTTGIGESFLAEKISAWEKELPKNISLAYLPSPGIVKLRLSSSGHDKEAIERHIGQQTDKLKEIIPAYMWGTDNEKLEEKIGEALKASGKTLVTAESCTGGYIAHRITSVPGSSAYYKGSVITYANDMKKQLLSISQSQLDQYGAVSKEVVTSMAIQARRLYDADYALAVSGIAGPEGGTKDKPVGTVWIAVAAAEGVKSKRYGFGDNRERNIIRASVSAMGILLKAIA